MRSPSLAIPLIQSAVVGAAAFLIGWLLNREEYEAFWIIFAACCARALVPALLPARWPAVFFAIDITLLCVGFVVGFWVGRQNWLYVHTVVKWTSLMWPLFLVLGAPLAWGLNRWTRARRFTGPYCRGCRYHLKGVIDWRCPECGRPFTLKELGVTAAELRADA